MEKQQFGAAAIGLAGRVLRVPWAKCRVHWRPTGSGQSAPDLDGRYPTQSRENPGLSRPVTGNTAVMATGAGIRRDGHPPPAGAWAIRPIPARISSGPFAPADFPVSPHLAEEGFEPDTKKL